MISTIQSYQLNNKITGVDLTKIPELSQLSKSVFADLKAKLPQSFQPGKSLVGKIHSMEETAKMLLETKEHSTQDKAFAFFKTAVSVSLVAVTITSGLFTAVGASFSLLFLLVIFYCNACEGIEKIERRLPDYARPWYWPKLESELDPRVLVALPCGMVLPLFEAFTRESRLERVLKQQIESIEGMLFDYKRQNSQLLPIAYQFYKDQSRGLRDELDRKIKNLEKSLSEMEKLPERSLIGEKELKDRIMAHQAAKDEFNMQAEFYQQFSVTSKI